MTDKEIIKALECCDYPTDDLCCECCFKDEYHCTTVLNEATIDLIKRQQAEIDKLNTNIETLESVIKRSFFNKAGFDIDPFAAIKAEAIKEFAERLKEKQYTYCDICGYKTLCVDVDEIGNLVKEMVGENNG